MLRPYGQNRYAGSHGELASDHHHHEIRRTLAPARQSTGAQNGQSSGTSASSISMTSPLCTSIK